MPTRFASRPWAAKTAAWCGCRIIEATVRVDSLSALRSERRENVNRVDVREWARLQLELWAAKGAGAKEFEGILAMPFKASVEGWMLHRP